MYDGAIGLPQQHDLATVFSLFPCDGQDLDIDERIVERFDRHCHVLVVRQQFPVRDRRLLGCHRTKLSETLGLRIEDRDERIEVGAIWMFRFHDRLAAGLTGE